LRNQRAGHHRKASTGGVTEKRTSVAIGLHGICIVSPIGAGADASEKPMTAWTVKDSNGELLADFAAHSRLDVGRKVVPQRYDPFRLQVSSSYRELFERAVSQILERKGWEIVRFQA
jgi:hypothetical protein